MSLLPYMVVGGGIGTITGSFGWEVWQAVTASLTVLAAMHLVAHLVEEQRSEE